MDTQVEESKETVLPLLRILLPRQFLRLRKKPKKLFQMQKPKLIKLSDRLKTKLNVSRNPVKMPSDRPDATF